MVYFSVTEEEIYNGLLKAENPANECFWFRRCILDLADNADDKNCSRYMDISNRKVDVEAQTLLGKLR